MSQKARIHRSSRRALYLESLEDRQLLASIPLVGNASGGMAPAYRTELPEAYTRAQDADADVGQSEATTGRVTNVPVPAENILSGDRTEEYSPPKGTASTPAADGSQGYGASTTAYDPASYYHRMDTTLPAGVIVVLPQVQPVVGQPEHAHPLAMPAFSRTVEPAMANEVPGRAAVNPAGTPLEAQPLLPRLPGRDARDSEVAGLPAISEDRLDQEVPEPSEALHNAPTTTDVSRIDSLLSSLLPIDRGDLERTVDAFFQQLDHLAEDLSDTWIGSRLTPCLTAAAVATAAYALARHHHQRSRPNSTVPGDDGRDQEWAWFTDCAILPPRDQP